MTNLYVVIGDYFKRPETDMSPEEWGTAVRRFTADNDEEAVKQAWKESRGLRNVEIFRRVSYDVGKFGGEK